jgi:hypothetical protein
LLSILFDISIEWVKWCTKSSNCNKKLNFEVERFLCILCMMEMLIMKSMLIKISGFEAVRRFELAAWPELSLWYSKIWL